MGNAMKVIGMMSGTSIDGVDAAVLETDGEGIVRPGPGASLRYDPAMRAVLRDALTAAPQARAGDPAIAQAERMLTDAHVAIVRKLLKDAGLAPSDIAYLGFHGQTILHRPQEGRTWQIGDGDRLAHETGIAVVNDFRSADVAAGGQGAPFVPLYHAALARRLGHALPIVVVNIGGVGNVTYVDDDEVLAFDTGPGNAPIDDWALKHTGKPVDENGELARAGCVDEQVLRAMLQNPYFDAPPPKSLDRLDFTFEAAAHLSPADGAATLTAFTAASLARAREHMPQPPALWIICGGGRHNPVLMAELRRRLGAEVRAAEDVGWRGDFIEAEAFAYLAMRSVKGLPLSIPGTTGVPRPLTGGRLHRPV
jgi:anhydro-N-acetylmuramic acid kinase